MVAFQELLHHGVIPGIGLEPGGEDVASQWNSAAQGVEENVAGHLEEQLEGKAVAAGVGEQEAGNDRGNDFPSTGDQAENGVEANAEFCAGDADEFIENPGDFPRGGAEGGRWVGDRKSKVKGQRSGAGLATP